MHKHWRMARGFVCKSVLNRSWGQSIENPWHQIFLWGVSCLQILIMTSKRVARSEEVNNFDHKRVLICPRIKTFLSEYSRPGINSLRQSTHHHAALSAASRIITTSLSCGVVISIFTCWGSLIRFRLTVIIAHCHILAFVALPYWYPSYVGNSDWTGGIDDGADTYHRPVHAELGYFRWAETIIQGVESVIYPDDD